jgi:hypothetical protein
VHQIFTLEQLTDHNVTKLTITKHPITIQVSRSPPIPPEMTSLHQQISQEYVHEQECAVEELHSRWSSSSSSRVIVDRLPSQPVSRHQSRRGSASGRLQRRNSKRTSGVIADSPPLQPLSRRRSAVGRLELSGSRWSSGSEAAFDTASSCATKQCLDSQELSCDEELWYV